MTVKDLIELLQKENPDSTVVILVPQIVYGEDNVSDEVDSLAIINGVTHKEAVYLEWILESN